jgi:hypothetical protein
MSAILDSASAEVGLEAENQVIDHVKQAVDHERQGLAINNPRLAERYIKGEIHFLMHFRLAGKEYLALYEPLYSRHAEATETKSGVEEAAVDAETRTHKGRDCGEQSMVLVGNIKAVEHPERIIPTLVRFGSVNRIYGTLRHTLYVSVVSGLVFRGLVEDGEAGLIPRSLAVGEHELPSEVVERASEVVDYVSGNQSEFSGRGSEICNVKEFISCLGIELGRITGRFFGKEPLACNFQITDMLFGPVNLFSDERESFV